ncbi:hypothetical protein Tco_0236622 [Tanacetum coccineum]
MKPTTLSPQMERGRYKDKDGMKIPAWMISEEIKHTEHYRMYAEVFGIDVPLNLSQPTESTQGMHRKPSAPRSTRVTPPAPVPTVDKADGMILQDTLQMVEGPENVIDDSSIHRNDDQNIPGTRLEPRSDKESPEVEITNDEEVEITNVVIPINVNEEEEEITDEELPVTDTTLTPSSSSLNTKLSTTNRLLSLFKAKSARFKRYKSFFQELQGRYGYLFEHLRAKFLSRKSFDTLDDHLQEVMVESLPIMVDKHIKEQVEKQVPESYMSGHILHVHPAQPQTTSVPEQQYQLYLSMKVDPQTFAVHPRDQGNPHDDAHPEGENSAKRQKTYEYEAHVTGESSGQVNEKEQGQSSLRNQEQTDDYDFWTMSYTLDDDEILTKQVSQDIMKEVSLTINEAELKKITDEMLRQRCTSGDGHQYHIDHMKNFLKSNIVWESRKEILASPHPRKTTPLKGSSGPEKIVSSLHKFPAIIFNDIDIEERTSRWVNKCVNKFNPYAWYGVEH